jgi:hypothetical protein
MEKQKIIVSGLPGRVATQIAETIALSENYALAPIGFSGKTKGKINILGTKVKLFPIVDRKGKEMHALIGGDEIIVDFSSEATIEDNITFFGKLGLNCVIGTSGLNYYRMYHGSVCITDMLQKIIYDQLDIIENNTNDRPMPRTMDDMDKYYARYQDFTLVIDREKYILNYEFSEKNPFLDQGLKRIRKEIAVRDRQYFDLGANCAVTVKKENMTAALLYPKTKDAIIAKVFHAIEYITKKKDCSEKWVMDKWNFNTIAMIG